jgi:hypothetical protein
MPTRTPTQSWSHLKPHLQRLEKEELLRLLHDLCALNVDNKVFLNSRFLAATSEEMAEPYRKIIRQVFNPNRGLPSFKLGAARKALNDFKKACADPVAVVDLMLFYVEQGVICTRTYGDIDEPFYASLASVYRSAAELTAGIADLTLVDQFYHRFDGIVRDTSPIGWGLQEEFQDIFATVLPAEWQD